MRRIAKSFSTVLFALLVIAMSMMPAFAVQYDNNDISYSYSEKGDCTLAIGDAIWVSDNYVRSHKFTVNGRTATCCWSLNSTPTAGTYRNATKYYLDAGAARAKAFYWLYLSNSSSIAASNKYDSSSKTYLEDIYNAMDDCNSLEASSAYAFVHCVIDYLQQGETNAYYGDNWNRAVVRFANLTRNYPNVPKEYRIFYFYPQGNAAQSIMSWEHTPHGYIKVIKSSSDTSVTNGNSSYTFENIEYYVSKSKTDFDTSGSNYIGYIKLNAAGEGHSKDGSRATLRFLPPGTYYVKEGYVPSGSSYVKNDTVYTVSVTANHTTTAPLVLRVSDQPKTCYGKIVKASTRPEITNGNPDYSMAGIRYSFSKSKTDFSPSGNNYIGYVELDENGVGYTENGSRATLRKLVPGTYYVKESVIPAGCKYKMDNTVYTMAFTFSNDKNHLKVLNVKDEPEGTSSAKVIKKSARPEITDGNALYSLEGAEFAVYKTRTDAENKTNPFTTVTTDENGVSTISNIELGTYYVRETKAPSGFKLSEEIKELKIETAQEEAYVVEFEDQPKLFTPEILLRKQTSDRDVTDYGLGGAEYTFKYFAGDYTENELDGKTPTKTWVFATDETGLCSFDLASFVGGDDFYEDEDGEIGIPLGTLVIQETKAPPTYKLDETVFIRSITEEGVDNTSQFNTPISIETVIPLINITVNKVWDDDNNRDGVRPKTLSVNLLRDGEIIETVELNKNNEWSHEFLNLPEGYADINLADGYHVYKYELKEEEIEHYDSSETHNLVQGDTPNEYFCTFTNTHTPKRMSVSGDKEWEDFEDLMKYRPSAIVVYLLRDGKKIAEKTVTKENNWHFEFTNLYMYHDGGKKYVYTFDEKAVDGYEKTVNGNTIINELITGSITIRKTDAKGNPLEGVEFKIICTDLENKSVISTFSDGKYHFDGYEEKEGRYKVYKTDKDGLAVVDNLPSGHYEIKEISTADGYMPYTDSIPVTIDDDSEETLDVLTDVENDKLILMDTGGAGTMMLYVIAFAMAGTAMLLCLFFIKKSKKSNLTKRKD